MSGIGVCAGPAVDAAAADERMRALFAQHARPVYAFLLRLTFGDRQLAEDLLQETMTRAWRHIDRLDADIDTLRPWLMTVARRVAIDNGRARKARPMEISSIDLLTLPSRDDVIDRVLAVHSVREAMRTLSPDHRRVLVETYYHDRSAAEAAAALGIPVGTVRSRVHYALRRLRATLDSRPRDADPRAGVEAARAEMGGAAG